MSFGVCQPRNLKFSIVAPARAPNGATGYVSRGAPRSAAATAPLPSSNGSAFSDDEHAGSTSRASIEKRAIELIALQTSSLGADVNWPEGALPGSLEGALVTTPESSSLRRRLV